MKISCGCILGKHDQNATATRTAYGNQTNKEAQQTHVRSGSHKRDYNLFMTTLRPPTYIVWSTDQIDLSDPFQRRWYIQQVLTHGRMEDIRTLDVDEIAAVLDEIILPEDVRSLWQRFFEARHATG